MSGRTLAAALVCAMASGFGSTSAGESLLANGDMEAGTVGAAPPGWELFWHPNVRDIQKDAELPLVTTEGGRNGTKAIRLTKPADLALVYTQQFIPVPRERSARYVFSVWLRAEKPTEVGLHLYYTPKGRKEGGPLRMRSHVNVEREWKRYEITLDDGFAVRIEDEYNLRPIIELETSAGHVELDDARMDVLPSGATPAVREQIDAFEQSLRQGPSTLKAPTGFNEGGIIVRPNGELFAFDGSFGVHSSGDGGQTWGPPEPLSIDDKFGRITGAIQLGDGTIGVWNEGWDRPVYFWKSADGGKTWSKRIQIAPKGAPLHGNVMIEMSVDEAGEAPAGWKVNTYRKDRKRNAPDSKSRVRRVAGGHEGGHAGVMTLDKADEWIYAEQWLTTDRPLRKGDEYAFRVATKADKTAPFDLFIEAWNSETGKGSRTRKRVDGAGDWQDREIRLTVTEDAVGLTLIRLIVQLYTPGTELRIDDAAVERTAPAGEARKFPLRNPSFEHVRGGRLVFPIRRGNEFYGGKERKDYGAYGTDVQGNRVMTESHGHVPEMSITHVFYSDDAGQSWQGSRQPVMIWQDGVRGGNVHGFCEPNVAELKDGRLLMFGRNPLGRIFQTASADGGKTWEYPTPVGLPSSLSPCSLKRIPENEHTLDTGRAGDLLCVWNNVSNDEIERGFRRGRLSAAVSKDDGRTWIHARTLDTAGLPAISGIAPLSAPGLVRADKDVGELPVPFGNVSYADVVFVEDTVLVRYHKSFTNPNFAVGSVMQILPLDWFYED